jgi:phosphoglycolate phosphatase
MNGFNCALFDLDGTLISSKGAIGRCLNETLSHFGLKPFDGRELHGLIGIPLREALSLRTHDYEPMVDYFRLHYMSTYLDGTRVYDGMEDILAELRKNKKKIGIVTLKHTPVAENVLTALGLIDYIDHVEGDDDTSPLKPDPHHILRVCEKLDVEPGKTVVIGDTVMDMEAGKEAKCRTIGVLWGAMSFDDLTNAKADFLARNPKELGELFERI